MSSKSFIAVFIALFLVLFLMLSVSLVATSAILDRRMEQMESASRGIQTAERLKSMLLTHNRNALLYPLVNDPDYLTSRREQTEQIAANFRVMDTLVANREEEEALDLLRESVSAYLDARRRIEALPLSPLEQYIQVTEPVEHALNLTDRYIEASQAHMSQLMTTINRQNSGMQKVGLALLVTGACILLGLFLAVVILLARPLARLRQTVALYGSGKESARADGGGLREIRDIASNFNRMAEKLEENRREQLSFIASIAHDLRNPLHAIAMASEVLLHKATDDAKPLARSIGNQARYLDILVGDLLDSSRLEADRVQLQCAREDILPLISEAVQLLRTATDLHRFRLELPPFPVPCPHDRRLISQVLHNLLSNAVKYSPRGGEVHVEGRMLPDAFSLSISDVGMGIEAADLERIFKPFQRTELTRKTIPGIGLGLSASRRIAEAHGGRLDVTSEPGRGSTFTLTLPLEREDSPDATSMEIPIAPEP